MRIATATMVRDDIRPPGARVRVVVIESCRRIGSLSRSRRAGLLHAIPIGRLDAEQMMNEIVPLFAVAVGRQRTAPAYPMIAAWEHEEVERLVRLDQRVRDLQRRRRVDVLIELAYEQQ